MPVGVSPCKHNPDISEQLGLTRSLVRMGPDSGDYNDQ